MSVNLITGYAGTAHITAAGDGAVNAGMFGSGKYVLNIGEKFGYEIISNNLIRIKSGYAIDQGRKIELAVNDYEEVEIDNGLQGVKRCDLIVMHYGKSLTTGIETATMKVIKGTSGDDYTDPAYTSGDIINGANEDDFLLYRVKINGLNIETVESLFSVTDSILNLLKEQAKTISGLNTNLDKKVNTSDVVNNLTSTSTTKPLSAAQGKTLNDNLTTHKTSSDHDNRYVPKTGGTFTGDITQQKTDATAIRHILKNSKRNIGVNVNNEGKFVIYDYTNNKAIMSVDDDKIYLGGPTFYYINTGSSSITSRALNSTNDGVGFQFDGNSNPVLYDGYYKIGIYGANCFKSNRDNVYTLGTSAGRWKQLYAATTTISTSDRNYKKDFANFDERHEALFMKLQPQTFKFKDGDSERTHFGFISQDVETALEECDMTSLDFAGFCKDIRKKAIYEEVLDEDGNPIINKKTNEVKTQYVGEEEILDEDGNPEYIYSLRYEEFIALNTHMIQKLYEENNELKEKLNDLEERLKVLEG